MPSQRCAVSWRRAWARPASGNTSRSFGSAGDLRSRGASRRGEGRPAPGCDRLRRRQTPCAVPYRATCPPKTLDLDIYPVPASGQRGDHDRRQLYELVRADEARHDRYAASVAGPSPQDPETCRRSCANTDKLARSLRHRRAPTMCGTLVRLTEPELIDREAPHGRAADQTAPGSPPSKASTASTSRPSHRSTRCWFWSWRDANTSSVVRISSRSATQEPARPISPSVSVWRPAKRGSPSAFSRPLRKTGS